MGITPEEARLLQLIREHDAIEDVLDYIKEQFVDTKSEDEKCVIM